jgi:hypothetical protein
MLNYSDAESPAKTIAIFYADKINSAITKEFFNGEKSFANSEEALEVARGFWKITDLASTDHIAGVSILNGIDAEFWLHKLFNKVYGYYEKNGFKEQWKIAESESN